LSDIIAPSKVARRGLGRGCAKNRAAPGVNFRLQWPAHGLLQESLDLMRPAVLSRVDRVGQLTAAAI